jgi:hypothetical protein
MLVGDKLSHAAVSEAYCLLTSYLREDGKIGAKYNQEHLKSFVVFLAEILKHPENFVDADRTPKERHFDGSLINPEHDGSGLA